MTTNLSHNGTSITVTPQGKFLAVTPEGKSYEAGSLATLKRKLDGANVFKQFSAYARQEYDVVQWMAAGREPAIVTVVGIKKPKAAWRGLQWKLSNGDTTDSAIPNTPENRAVLDEMVAAEREYMAAYEVIREKRAAVFKAARDRLVKVRPPKE